MEGREERDVSTRNAKPAPGLLVHRAKKNRPHFPTTLTPTPKPKTTTTPLPLSKLYYELKSFPSLFNPYI
jgi:hypothetical protein